MKYRKVIAIAVHPDDETLSFGGTLLKHKTNGDEIFWLIITNALIEYNWPKEIVDSRQIEIDVVAKKYGFSKVFKLDFPTTKLDQVPNVELINSISKVFKEIKPNIVYLPHKSDIHTDHQITFQAAFSCTKSFRFPEIELVACGETLSETEFAPPFNDSAFIPNTFNDITNYMEEKISIMSIYESEVMKDYGPRSLQTIKSLGRFRGSRIGVQYAEAFNTIFLKI